MALTPLSNGLSSELRVESADCRLVCAFSPFAARQNSSLLSQPIPPPTAQHPNPHGAHTPPGHQRQWAEGGGGRPGIPTRMAITAMPDGSGSEMSVEALDRSGWQRAEGGGGRPASVPTRMALTPLSDNTGSSLRVEAADRPGLLMVIVDVLTGMSVSMTSAEIDTEGVVAKDVFMVSYHGGPLDDEMITSCTTAVSHAPLLSGMHHCCQSCTTAAYHAPLLLPIHHHPCSPTSSCLSSLLHLTPLSTLSTTFAFPSTLSWRTPTTLKLDPSFHRIHFLSPPSKPPSLPPTTPSSPFFSSLSLTF
ncbi:unnamed protein product [Closterium sp. Naga37s-1]|nr:unnamed protein product [Closterium sp. Naga37s-1]